MNAASEPQLHLSDCRPDPYDQFTDWFMPVQSAGYVEPTAMTLATDDAHGQPAARLAEVLPARLLDLYAGAQLVVLGQYRCEEELRFELTGTAAPGPLRFGFTLPLRKATTRHAFVPRLWASRQIAFLVGELRQQGGDLDATARANLFQQPRLRELRDEILRLSTRFGVLGEYRAD